MATPDSPLGPRRGHAHRNAQAKRRRLEARLKALGAACVEHRRQANALRWLAVSIEDRAWTSTGPPVEPRLVAVAAAARAEEERHRWEDAQLCVQIDALDGSAPLQCYVSRDDAVEILVEHHYDRQFGIHLSAMPPGIELAT